MALRIAKTSHCKFYASGNVIPLFLLDNPSEEGTISITEKVKNAEPMLRYADCHVSNNCSAAFVENLHAATCIIQHVSDKAPSLIY